MSDELLGWLEDKSITEVECLVSDMAGIPRGKIVPVNKFKSALRDNTLRLPEYVFGQLVTGEYMDSEVLQETGGDINLVPDASCFWLVPWYKEPTAQIIHDAVYHDGKVVDLAPRQVLKNVIKCFDALKLKPIIAPELEFSLSAARRNPIRRCRRLWGVRAVLNWHGRRLALMR